MMQWGLSDGGREEVGHRDVFTNQQQHKLNNKHVWDIVDMTLQKYFN